MWPFPKIARWMCNVPHFLDTSSGGYLAPVIAERVREAYTTIQGIESDLESVDTGANTPQRKDSLPVPYLPDPVLPWTERRASLPESTEQCTEPLLIWGVGSQFRLLRAESEQSSCYVAPRESITNPILITIPRIDAPTPQQRGGVGEGAGEGRAGHHGHRTSDSKSGTDRVAKQPAGKRRKLVSNANGNEESLELSVKDATKSLSQPIEDFPDFFYAGQRYHKTKEAYDQYCYACSRCHNRHHDFFRRSLEYHYRAGHFHDEFGEHAERVFFKVMDVKPPMNTDKKGFQYVALCYMTKLNALWGIPIGVPVLQCRNPGAHPVYQVRLVGPPRHAELPKRSGKNQGPSSPPSLPNSRPVTSQTNPSAVFSDTMGVETISSSPHAPKARVITGHVQDQDPRTAQDFEDLQQQIEALHGRLAETEKEIISLKGQRPNARDFSECGKFFQDPSLSHSLGGLGQQFPTVATDNNSRPQDVGLPSIDPSWLQNMFDFSTHTGSSAPTTQYDHDGSSISPQKTYYSMDTSIYNNETPKSPSDVEPDHPVDFRPSQYVDISQDVDPWASGN